ncbi:MAG TPA: aminodeoxychorismate lyase [Gallionellaceae bacterium]
MLINGAPGNAVSIQDRGLLYGDGVFRTMLVRNHLVQHWPAHYKKLQQDCQGIGLECPAEPLLRNELELVIQQRRNATAKIIITRGESARGYAPPASPRITRIVTSGDVPEYPEANSRSGVRLHVCQLRLSHQPRLAGIKHLNRLENVLAAAEWSDPEIAEGLLLDQRGLVIEGTRTNLFCVKDGALFTPDLAQCGVAGLQRERVIEWARLNGVDCQISSLTLHDLQSADEIFLVNSIIGLWPVQEMSGFHKEYHPTSKHILEWLNHDVN